MKSRLVGVPVVGLCALILLGLSVEVMGCGMPWASASDTTISPAVVVNQTMYQLQAALGLPDGAISRSFQPPILDGSDVALRWPGGRADVDLDTGRIRAILADSAAKALVVSLSDAQLDKEADRIVRLLGWDSAALETQGFAPGDSATVDYGAAGTVYQKTWVGHDSDGVPNEGVIEVGLNTSGGDLHSFLFNPGPANGLDTSKIITKDEAIKTAKAAAIKSAAARLATSDTRSTTTTRPGSLLVESATLVHSDKTGITGGKDILVWMVKLVEDTGAGQAATTVYVDAVTSKVLVVMAT